MGETGELDGQLIGAVLYKADAAVLRWMAERIPEFEITAHARALGVVRHETLVAGVSYERFNGVHLEMAIAAEPGSGWADRSTLARLFAYPFLHLDCLAVSVLVAETNLASMNLATKLGFKPEAMVKYAAPDGGTLFVLKMLRDDCRWLRPAPLPPHEDHAA